MQTALRHETKKPNRRNLRSRSAMGCPIRRRGKKYSGAMHSSMPMVTEFVIHASKGSDLNEPANTRGALPEQKPDSIGEGKNENIHTDRNNGDWRDLHCAIRQGSIFG